MHHYGLIAKLLTLLLHTKSFQWRESAQQTFHKLKNVMIATSVLCLPDFNQPFVLEIDDCDIGIGAVILQAGHHSFSKEAAGNSF